MIFTKICSCQLLLMAISINRSLEMVITLLFSIGYGKNEKNFIKRIYVNSSFRYSLKQIVLYPFPVKFGIKDSKLSLICKLWLKYYELWMVWVRGGVNGGLKYIYIYLYNRLILTVLQ